MGSIPLPALDYKPIVAPQVQATDPLEQYGRLMAIQGQQQQMQQRAQQAPLQTQMMQQQVQEGQQNQAARQALNAAYSGAITKDDQGNPTIDSQKLAAGLANTPAAYQTPAVMKGITDFQKSRLDLQSTATELQQKQADLIGSAASAVKAANYDPTLAHSLLDTLPQSPQLNQIRSQIDNPQTLKQMIDSAIQNSPKQRELTAQETTAGAHALESKYKVVNGTLMDLSGQTPQPAMAGQLNPQQWSQAVDSVVPPTGGNQALNQRTHSQVDFYIKQGNTDAAQKAIAEAAAQVGDIEKATNPQVENAKIIVANAEGTARANAYGNMREYPVFDHQIGKTVMASATDINNAPPGRYTAASYTPESLGAKDATNYFVQGKGGQQLTAFNTALNHLNTLDNLAGDLGNSNLQIFNKAAQAWAQQTGNPAPSNFAAAVNAMSGEVASALKASGATDPEIAKAASTFRNSQSPQQLQGAINTYRTLLQAKATNLKGQYDAGMQGRPNFAQQSNAAPSRPSGVPANAIWNPKGNNGEGSWQLPQ